MDDLNGSFFETEAGQYLANSYRYLTAARVLRRSDEWRNAPGALQQPVLHLLSHGAELLLKYPLLRSGMSQRAIAKEYGHNLEALWRSSATKLLRDLLLDAAAVAWEEAQRSGEWDHESFQEDPRLLLPEQVVTLGHLHDRDSGFALRYTVRRMELAPRPAFLIDAFYSVADRVAKNPAALPSPAVG